MNESTTEPAEVSPGRAADLGSCGERLIITDADNVHGSSDDPCLLACSLPRHDDTPDAWHYDEIDDVTWREGNHCQDAAEDDETPGCWQVRTALSGTLNALQIVALSLHDDLAAMAKDALAKADADMAQVAPEDDPATRLLDLPLPENDSGASTVRGYLVALLTEVWREEGGFSGKRPFGNSGWQSDLYGPMVRAGLVKGSLDEDGYLDTVDHSAADTLILTAIAKLGEVTQ